MQKLVYVCAPLSGDIIRNLLEVIRYTRYVLKCGAVPIVPHFFALSLDDNNPEERGLGMGAGRFLLLHCDEMWIFGPRISEGMVSEMKLCEHVAIHMKHISDDEVDKLLGG